MSINLYLFWKGLLLVCFVIYTQQAAISTSTFDGQNNFEKRRVDAQSRSSIPIFRGSNLGLFIRKRPSPAVPEHSAIQKKEVPTLTNSGENDSAELSYNLEHPQRRFDDYSENPGPMFGR